MPKGKHILSMPKGKHVFGTARVGEKGQIVIPKEAREIFDISPGDTLLILGDEESGIVITKSEVINGVALRILGAFEKEERENGSN
jgi:AbrB family looped-hinge helix DNA binding protein